MLPPSIRAAQSMSQMACDHLHLLKACNIRINWEGERGENMYRGATGKWNDKGISGNDFFTWNLGGLNMNVFIELHTISCVFNMKLYIKESSLGLFKYE